jgi:hypothetical protein
MPETPTRFAEFAERVVAARRNPDSEQGRMTIGLLKIEVAKQVDAALDSNDRSTLSRALDGFVVLEKDGGEWSARERRRDEKPERAMTDAPASSETAPSKPAPAGILSRRVGGPLGRALSRLHL